MSDFEFQNLLEDKLRKEYAKEVNTVARGVPDEVYRRKVGYLDGIRFALEASKATHQQLVGGIHEELEERGYDS